MWIPLIVVNCIVLGRAEAFAYHNTVWLSIADGLGMGIGYTIVIVGARGVPGARSGRGQLMFLGSDARRAARVRTSRPNILLLFPGAFILFGFIIAGSHALEPAHSGASTGRGLRRRRRRCDVMHAAASSRCCSSARRSSTTSC